MMRKDKFILCGGINHYPLLFILYSGGINNPNISPGIQKNGLHV